MDPNLWSIRFQRDIQVVGEFSRILSVIHGYDGSETSRNFHH